ncbi:MAG: class I SAM-dependent methyltransferase, partial [bacterium]
MQVKEKVDFNEYAREYENILENDLKFFGENVGYFAEYKVKIVKETLQRPPVKILEFGCGIGLNLRYFRKHFPQAEVSGCDISQISIDVASRQNTGSELFIIEPENLKLREEKYDLIFVSCV